MNDHVVAAGAGSLLGLGVFVVVSAWRGRLNMMTLRNGYKVTGYKRLGIGAAIFTAVWAVTGWTLAAFTISAVTVMASAAAARHSSKRDDRVIVDAVAVWTEQLRDMLAGSSGLEQTISSTAPHAPTILREPLERLVASMSFSSLPQALHRFAREVDHPTADFVVAALSTAATRQVRELGTLLGHLASCARDEARMHTRIWVGRSRTRSAVKIIATVVTVFVVGLALVSPDYLAPYRTAEGQVVLSGVVLVFFGALFLMQRLSLVASPDRFVGRRTGAST